MDNQLGLKKESWLYGILLQGATSTPRLSSNVTEATKQIVSIVTPSSWTKDLPTPRFDRVQWINRIRAYVLLAYRVCRPFAILFSWCIWLVGFHPHGSNMMSIISDLAFDLTVLSLYIPMFFALCGILWYVVTVSYFAACRLLVRSIYRLA